uniref:Reverse transcriptase domain-containing protein n=1 Tax=Tanacetum cinerariifolium TaxID=118510 RepID=A0A6L2KMX0_TANCI|nr:reverse transcriptase domain-containing protein [Tanacetum cinerariifolium]
MSTRSSARNLFPPFDNPELTIRKRSRTDPTLLNDSEMAAEGPGDLPVPDLRTMEELCQPSLNGPGGPIAQIAIQATNFGLKNDMIQQVQNSCQFHGLLGGTFMKRCPEECYDLIENMTAHYNVWDTSAQRTTVGNTQNVYAARAYQGNSYQPQGNRNLANDAILKNMQTNMTYLTNLNLELKYIFGQFMKMNTASSSGLRTLLERETEITKDTVHPTNNESTEDVQPPVVQTKSPILNSEPVISPIIEPVASPVSAPKPNQRPLIPYPSRLHDQKLRDKAND